LASAAGPVSRNVSVIATAPLSYRQTNTSAASRFQTRL